MFSTQNEQSIWYNFNNLSKQEDIQHFVTTRHGGISEGSMGKLNLSFETGDNPEHVIQNRNTIAQALKIEPKRWVMQNQMHTCNVHLVTKIDSGRGFYNPREYIPCNDALITNQKGICLFVFAADCVPLLFYDTKNQAIAAVHSGWKGTVKKIAKYTISQMIQSFGSKPEHIIAAIGPSIGACCYEIGKEVVIEVEKSYGQDSHVLVSHPNKEKKHFDLWKANQLQLLEIGIPEENIEIANICTCCNSNLFFSARSPEQPSGRFGAGIMMLENL